MAALMWAGGDLKNRWIDAAKRGVDRTMSECVIEAKQNHDTAGNPSGLTKKDGEPLKPFWENRTATAEGSIRVQTFAELDGAIVRGLWGSVDVDYMIYLEIWHGSALRRAADSNYPGLADYIEEYGG